MVPLYKESLPGCVGYISIDGQTIYYGKDYRERMLGLVLQVGDWVECISSADFKIRLGLTYQIARIDNDWIWLEGLPKNLPYSSYRFKLSEYRPLPLMKTRGWPDGDNLIKKQAQPLASVRPKQVEPRRSRVRLSQADKMILEWRKHYELEHGT